MRRAHRVSLAIALACLGSTALAVPAAHARGAPLDASALQAQLAHQLSRAGSPSGGYVYDLTDARVLFASRANVLHPPASVEKLYTATTALARMGASARMHTLVLGSGHVAADGEWVGDLYLRGGGDPTFGSHAFIRSHYGGVGASVQALAAQLVHDGIRRVSGKIEGDESYFDSLRGEPSTGYAPDPYLEGTLSALAFNRGETGRYRGRHATAEFAAHALALALRADHVAVSGNPGAASAPPSATTLASVSSPTLAQLLTLMLPPSDNFFAETLLKDLGARFGGVGSTAAGASVVRTTIASLLGAHPDVVDGSGLSREDLTSPEQVVALLRYLSANPLGGEIRDALAVAGHSGTLSKRMLHSPAAGRCRGKTGTLVGVSNLAGYCEAANGHLVAFAFFNDAIAIETARSLQDSMAIAIARY
jgi:D-alanyl-D-alanine carboxypeptidase/D-alanyl-D-alanine-endopeptidase (penicillin-binding protein 4)